MSKKRIKFSCYNCGFTEGGSTVFLFYPDGVWDDWKYSLQEALEKYPPKVYEWTFFEEDEWYKEALENLIKSKIDYKKREFVLDLFSETGFWVSLSVLAVIVAVSWLL